jgi:RimJ/RimL family protein N-acetyltransferase
MLEWMHDPDLAQFFQADFAHATTSSVHDFIQTTDPNQRHFAIADSKTNEYLGTLSLKNINLKNKNAELAIALRQKAIGANIATPAITKLFQIAFTTLKLHKIYLNVLTDNHRARHFYEKIGFVLEGETKDQIYLRGKYRHLAWYGLTKSHFHAHQPQPPFKRLHFPELGDQRGHLVVAETNHQIPFLIRRVFYIYGSDPKVVRGQHANRYSQFVLINIQGQSKVKIDPGAGKTTTLALTRPHQGLYLNKMVWKEMSHFSPDSILLCLASHNYDPQEYLRDYQEFLQEVAL